MKFKIGDVVCHKLYKGTFVLQENENIQKGNDFYSQRIYPLKFKVPYEEDFIWVTFTEEGKEDVEHDFPSLYFPDSEEN